MFVLPEAARACHQVIQAVHPLGHKGQDMRGPAFTRSHMPARMDHNQLTEVRNPNHHHEGGKLGAVSSLATRKRQMTQERPELLVVSPIRPRQMDLLSAEVTLHRLERSREPERFLDGIAARITPIVTTGSAGAPSALVDSLPSLRLIATSSVGVDKIDLDTCRARGIIVANTPDVLTDDVADLAVGLVVGTQRRLIVADAWVRSGA